VKPEKLNRTELKPKKTEPNKKKNRAKTNQIGTGQFEPVLVLFYF
jgi:hypothetical protein